MGLSCAACLVSRGTDSFCFKANSLGSWRWDLRQGQRADLFAVQDNKMRVSSKAKARQVCL